jgi:dihydroflavonol-4-reductase
MCDIEHEPNSYTGKIKAVPDNKKEREIMNRIYLITGAAGHLGSVVARRLLDKEETVRALVLPGEKHIPQNAQIFFGDVRSKESLKQCFEGIEKQELIVIHCAGIVPIASSIEPVVYEVNVTGTKNVVELCIKYHAKKFIYVSSVHAISEEPHGSTTCETKDFGPDKVVGGYAKSKAEATAYVLRAAKQGLNACIVHPSGIIGPYDYGRGT